MEKNNINMFNITKSTQNFVPSQNSLRNFGDIEKNIIENGTSYWVKIEEKSNV